MKTLAATKTANVFRNSVSVILMVCAICVFPGICPAQDYYVSPTGNDDYAGSFDFPWQTIQKAANTAVPGSTVRVRGGVYNERVTIGVSGSVSGYVTFRNYEGETPILDGTGLTPVNDDGLFYIANKSYVVIRGFSIRNWRTASSDAVPIGIYVNGACHHIELRDNRISFIETSGSDGNAHGIAVYGDATNSVRDIVVSGNEIFNLTLGSSEALVLNGNVESFQISDNRIHDCDNIGIDLIGFEGVSPDPLTDQARNGTVSGNTVWNISSYGNPAYGNEYSAGGIYVDGGRDIVIEENTVYQSDIGIEIASEHQGKATRLITVRNNLIHENRLTGIALGGYDTLRGSTEDCAVVNNTLYHNNSLADGTGEIFLQFAVRNNIIKNNILYANSQGVFIGNDYTQNSGNIWDYNLYFSVAGVADSVWNWQAVAHTGFDAYRSWTGNDSHSVFADPRFVNPATHNFHLESASPAINIGENLSASGIRDVDGDTRIQGGQIDMGADEYGSVNAGDIDASGTVDIGDAILGLKICSELAALPNPHTNADIDGDAKIGLPEVIYALRKTAGL